MSEIITRSLRDNWYLVALLALALAAAGFGYARSASTSPLPPEAQAHLVSAREEVAGTAPIAPAKSSSEDIASVLESYRARYDANPKDKDAPALLAAMGNLYRQKQGNYREAALCFERLIAEHPDAPNIRDAYLQLVICYERAGDAENRQRVLRRIVELYPPESQEHAYASTLLY